MLDGPSQLSQSPPEPTYVVIGLMAIHTFPRMFAISNPSFKLVVPKKYVESALFELLGNKKKATDESRLRLLFEKAANAQIVEAIDIKYKPDDGVEALAVNVAEQLVEDGKSVILVVGKNEFRSYEKMIDKISILHSIEILEVKQFRDLLNSSESTINQDLLQLAKEFNLYKYNVPDPRLWSVLIEPVIIALLILILLAMPQAIVGFVFKLSTWLAVLIVIMFSTFLFWYRNKYRFYYGVLETIFGIMIASKVISFNLDYTKLATIDYITLVSGVYVIIRGLDNMERGLPYIDFDRLKDLWETVFEPPKPRI